MRHWVLFWALLVLLALPAWGADTNKYPFTLVDSTCTDSFDSPTATSTAGVIGFDGRQPRPAAQTSGSGDGYCDNDSRILASSTAIVADTTFGPFSSKGIKGVILFADGDTVTGGNTQYHIAVAMRKPHDGAVIELDTAAQITGAGNKFWPIGIDPGTPNQDTVDLLVPLPNIFYINLDLNTATSWAGDISLLPWRQ